MNNFTPTKSSATTFSPIIALALAGVIGIPSIAEGMVEEVGRFEMSMAQSSYHGVSSLSTVPAPASFEARLSSFFAALSISQSDIDKDIQGLISSNLASLYED